MEVISQSEIQVKGVKNTGYRNKGQVHMTDHVNKKKNRESRIKRKSDKRKDKREK